MKRLWSLLIALGLVAGGTMTMVGCEENGVEDVGDNLDDAADDATDAADDAADDVEDAADDATD